MSNRYRGPSKDASYQVSVHLARFVEIFLKCKGDANSRTLIRTSDITETRNLCVLKVILLAISHRTIEISDTLIKKY
jgi:hypothetical protein